MAPTEFAPEWLEVEKQMGGRNVLHGDSGAAMREQFNGLMAALAPFAPPPDPEVTQEDKTIDGVPCRIHRPKNASGKLPVGVFYHSGGFVCGNLDSEAAFCDFLAHHGAGGCIIVNTDYRLAPEHKLPAAMDDSLKVWKWTAANVDSLGGDSSKMFVVGGSAGGCLSLSITASIVADEKMRGQLKGCLSFVPATMSPDNLPDEYKGRHTSHQDNSEAANTPVLDDRSIKEFFSEAGADPHDPRHYPALATEAHAKFPRTYICACEGDPLRDDAIFMNEILQKAGVKTQFNLYKGLPHYFWIMPGLPQAGQFMADTLEGLKFVLS